jgi:Zn-dependent protease
VSLAGIAANLILAVGSLLVLVVVLRIEGALSGPVAVLTVLGQAAYFALYINLILAFFNLIPLPPLDGSHVLFHLLPPRLGARYRELGRYGIGILMLLFFAVPGAINVLLFPVDLLMEAADLFIRLWI